jgi:hypothetical protein
MCGAVLKTLKFGYGRHEEHASYGMFLYSQVAFTHPVAGVLFAPKLEGSLCHYLCSCSVLVAED